MSDKDIEQELQAKGKTAPRITPDYIDSVIVSEHYFTAANGHDGAEQYEMDTGAKKTFNPAPVALTCLTFCVLVLQNGFTVTGESACASPENFDAEIGRKTARRNALNKIWPLEGYLLKQKLHDATV
ncbi:hypothetical protein MIB43_017210 [Providencia rettgeri]|uniref:Gp49 family protein n=1 Tax=Providencia rettgeri TaxID=587 RepID=UPI001F03C317|nr:Gp49 family protein [Providencia rettgeri]MCG9951652.1 hypothetical protein [Providencia rettgeri]